MSDLLPLRARAASADPPDTGATLVVGAKRLAKLLCCGLRTIRAHDAAGKLPRPVRIGGKVVWVVDEIRAWLAAGAPDRETWEARRAARK